MQANEYQKEARKLDIYPPGLSLTCHIIGIGNEAGEVLGKLKKQIRDHNSYFYNLEFKQAMKKELGDVYWYLANASEDLGLTLKEIAEVVIYKRETNFICHVIRLSNRAGNVLGRLEKQICYNCDFSRLGFKSDMKKLLGEVYQVLDSIAEDLDLTLEEIGEANITKLKDRQARGKLQGSGDDR